MGLLSEVKESVLSLEYMTHKRTFGSKILYYHDISDFEQHCPYTNMATSLEMFKKHLQVIDECGFEIVNQITNPERQVMIGLDDGWAGIYEIKDFLIEKGIYPSLSIAPALLNCAGYLSSNQVVELHKIGFNIVCHSWLHQSITLYNNYEKAMAREFLDSKKFLENLISEEVNTFCYPQGIFSEKTYQKALESGYDEIWSVVDGDYNDEVFPKVKKRCLVQFSSPKELKWILYGTNRILGLKHFKSTYQF